MNNKGQELSVNEIVLIVLGVAVLTFLVLGFTTGWDFDSFRNKTFFEEEKDFSDYMACKRGCRSMMIVLFEVGDYENLSQINYEAICYDKCEQIYGEGLYE
tara:strand:+ start:1900 stop:2202 length:303 start_codon:yes stop_codon:yes gene_type:complete